MSTDRSRSAMSPAPRWRRTGTAAARITASAAIGLALLAGCTDDPETIISTEPAECAPAQIPDAVDATDVEAADTDGTTIRLVTHDSFYMPSEVFDAFTEDTGIEVEVLPSGDAGTMVSSALLTAGNPVGDVMFGIDTTFLCRGTSAGLFLPYEASALDDVPEDLRQAPEHLATPIDVGDVCLNYSMAEFPNGEGAPETLDDLTEAALSGTFVTPNPETSSPGMSFLLATIAAFGDDGWEDYWKDLRDNDVEVTGGWTEAYEGSFGSGSGDRSIVTSYASSPVADVLYSIPPRDEPAIGVVTGSCFRQVEFAGILQGTEHPEAAAKLVDFMLSADFQSEIPLNMFVAPANGTVDIPELYEAHAALVEDPLTLDPAVIEAGRDGWTARWTEIVLR